MSPYIVNLFFWGALGVALAQVDVTFRKPMYWIILVLVLGIELSAKAIR